MNQLTELMIGTATGILAILAGMIVHEVKKYLIVKGGKRAVESVWAFNQWGGTTTTINVADLFKADFYVMKFDENGNPDWTDLTWKINKLSQNKQDRR